MQKDYVYKSPRELAATEDKQREAQGGKDSNMRMVISREARGTKTATKKVTCVKSPEEYAEKTNSMLHRGVKRNFLPVSSVVEFAEDPHKLNERSLRMNACKSKLTTQTSFEPQNEQTGSTLHGRLTDIKK